MPTGECTHVGSKQNVHFSREKHEILPTKRDGSPTSERRAMMLEYLTLRGEHKVSR